MSTQPQPVETTKESPKRDPWTPLFQSQSSFLSDLECIGEMVSVAVPALKNKDEERTKRIDHLAEEIETDKGKTYKIKSARNAQEAATKAKELLGHLIKLRRGDRMFRQGIVITIVSMFDKFLISVLSVCYQQNTGWLKHPDKKISYKELLEITSLDSIKSEIIQKEIDILMRDSHHAQLTFLDSQLKLGIEAKFPGWHNFLEITERRNLFVHTGGRVSLQYLSSCKRWGIPLDEKIKEEVSLLASEEYIRKALDCFYELSARIAQAVARRLFSECFEYADKELNNRTVELLTEERWELAERIFEYARSIPEDLTSKSEMKYYFLINLCIARKFSGKPIKEFLHSVDWTPFHPKYHLAVAVLEERFDEAERLMRNQAVQDEVTEAHFKEWPLLRDFRKTEAFLNAYSDIYKKDFNQEFLEDAEKKIKEQQDDMDNLTSSV